MDTAAGSPELLAYPLVARGLTPDLPVLKRETQLPVVVDPSHAAGRSDLVLPLARAAVAAGADGVMVEVHPQPRMRSATARSRSGSGSSRASPTRSARSSP